MSRKDNRDNFQLRDIKILPNYIAHAEGSVLISFGRTKVLCTATIEERSPSWMAEQGKQGGWITAEYSMIPRSTKKRVRRETKGLRGRTQEIQRLIGRSIRAGFNLTKLPPITCIIDCDVIEADGGTRTTSITGGYLAALLALQTLIKDGRASNDIFLSPVAAISVGIVNKQCMLDLCYEEDVNAEVDANFVLNKDGNIIEAQATAEGSPFKKRDFDTMFNLAKQGIDYIFKIEEDIISDILN